MRSQNPSEFNFHFIMQFDIGVSLYLNFVFFKRNYNKNGWIVYLKEFLWVICESAINFLPNYIFLSLLELCLTALFKYREKRDRRLEKLASLRKD